MISSKKMNLTICQISKKMNLAIGPRSRPRVVVRAQVLGFLGQNSIVSSDFGSVRSDRAGNRTYPGRKFRSESASNFRFRSDMPNPNPDSEYPQSSESYRFAPGSVEFFWAELRPGSAFRTGLSPVRTGPDGPKCRTGR